MMNNDPAIPDEEAAAMKASYSQQQSAESEPFVTTDPEVIALLQAIQEAHAKEAAARVSAGGSRDAVSTAPPVAP